MKLVEILARELKEWPIGGCNYIAQDYDGDLGSYRYKPKLVSCDKNDHVWHHSGHIMNICNLSCVADDACEAIVTLDTWKAELARMHSELSAKPTNKPNKDGWIRHRGGKCPVDGEVKVETRQRGGQIATGKNLRWGHSGLSGDIMAYRIHKPAEQPVIEPDIYADDKDECGETLQVTYHDTDGPLQWRDRITEIDRTVEELEEERVSLVQRLECEGFQLLPAKLCVPLNVTEDWQSSAVTDGKFIQAIKEHRHLYGSSLKEAKRAVEIYRDANRRSK